MSAANIMLKRVYQEPAPDDGQRILVERLWPRGVSRAAARIDHWFKHLAPSHDLRRWYDHRPDRWPHFRERYQNELDAIDRLTIEPLVEICRSEPVTFIFAAREIERNSATVLRAYVLARLCAKALG